MCANSPKPPNQEWSNQRLETTYNEARAVIEAQQRAITDIDNKAVRTVRITVVLIGIVVSVAQLGAIAFQPVIVAIGGSALVLSLVAGVSTYSESDLTLGPDSEFLVELVLNRTGIRWDHALLVEFAHWIDNNGADISYNGWLLYVTQVLFALGVLFTTLSIAYYPIRGVIDGFWTDILMGSIGVGALPGALFLLVSAYTRLMSDNERSRETGQRSHKGPAVLSKLFRKDERRERLRKRDRVRAEIERLERESNE